MTKRVDVSGEQFRQAYMESVKAGENMPQFAARVGLKVGSAIARLSNIRASLKERGATPEQIALVFPSLTRVVGSGRTKSKTAFIDTLMDEIATAPPAAAE
jgi:hypothetical protein